VGTVVRDKPMLRTCDRPGCETLTLGSFCVAHEPEIAQVEFVRGRPHPPAFTSLPLQLRLPRKTSA
jgi:hypothetical protein